MKIYKMFLLTVLFSAVSGLTVVNTGCSKSPDEEKNVETVGMEMKKDAEMEAEKTADKLADAAAEVTEQTLCPVMNAPINKELFVEYKGKKVYFCCAGCEETFKQDPEKYISKLPQFAQ